MINIRTLKTSTLNTMSSSGARPKSDLTLWVERTTEEYIDNTLANYDSIDMMRDYWYTMKGLPEMAIFRREDDELRLSQNKSVVTDKIWSDKINTLITKYIEDIALDDYTIYRRLGLTSEIFTPNDSGIPIIVITEKKATVMDETTEKFYGTPVHSTGQLPTFEATLMADYLNECDYSIGYIFVFTDYDPAGETIYDSIKDKMDLFSTEISIEVIHVEIDTMLVNSLPNYPLTDNALNRKWIDEGKTTGMEFNNINVLPYMPNQLEISMNIHIDPRLYVAISRLYWEQNEVMELQYNDETYKKWKSDYVELESNMLDRKQEYREAVRHIDTDFIYEEDEAQEYETIVRKGETKMEEDDLEYFYDLLDYNSPYKDDYDLMVRNPSHWRFSPVY